MIELNGVKENNESPVKIPASNITMPGSEQLSSLPLPKDGASYRPESRESAGICSDWIDSINDLFKPGREDFDLSEAFIECACWRDLLCLTWDFHTLQDRNSIKDFIKEFVASGRKIKFELDESADHKKPAFVPLDFDGDKHCIQAWFTLETDIGRGRGIVKMVGEKDESFRAFTIFTTLEVLKGHEELIKDRRPAGVKDGQDRGPANWKDKRVAEQNFEDGREPAVLILGTHSSKSNKSYDECLLVIYRCWSRWSYFGSKIKTAQCIYSGD